MLTQMEGRTGTLVNINEFAAITIRMASPERIKEWSCGEVKKPETINYRTLKPELEGLFCEKIFGSTKDWECYCGKFKSIRYRGVICDRCQVEVTHSKVRRERMGHIELVAPVSHIWYFKCIPSKMGVLLGMTQKELDRVLYFQNYIVLDPRDVPGLKKKQTLDESQYQELLRTRPPGSFEVGMGAEAILKLLQELDLEKRAQQIEETLALARQFEKSKKGDAKTSKFSKAEIKNLLREREVIVDILNSGKSRANGEPNRPEWMILRRLPVIPPELRPMVQLEGGRFATSDLNDLYRRVINRNNRLKRLNELRAPDIIIRNEKRMLQEAVDALLDNGRRGRPVKGANNNRVLKSLSDMLKGKQGRFRQNLLGKRVDYSGRSVIVVGPELSLHQCGLPKKMALELFKPFIMRVLVNRNIATNIKAAKKMVEREDVAVWEVIEDVIADHPVLLNRAPTLHRLGIQAFQPVLVEGKAIRVHPLVCVAFNADFDGDQMAVHVPLSAEAIVEAKVLMSANRNILSPASGKPVITPTQDIVLGIYYLTKEKGSAAQTNRRFADEAECLYAYETGVIDLQGRVNVRVQRGGGKRIETTPGRIIFNQVLPPDFEYVNTTLGKAQLGRLIQQVFSRYQESVTAAVADKIKKLGFEYSSKAGISIGIDDMRVPAQKDQLIALGKEEVNKINAQFDAGVITEKERYTKIIDLWTSRTDEIARVMFEGIEMDREGFNPIFIMADSGARGSKQQIKQLAGMRGLMADPFGRIRETPITSNFREGMSVIEFFQSTTGSRKGLTDTALKTANAGYLTRRLVDAAQDLVVTEEDCQTTRGISLIVDEASGNIRSSADIAERIMGRFLTADLMDEDTGDCLVPAGTYIDPKDRKLVDLVRNSNIRAAQIRSVLTCESERGVCRKCYGQNLATGRLVEIGEAVGIIAAQSIGEPGTQLTLRTFHVGGTASADDTYLRARFTGVITRLPGVKKQVDGTDYVIEDGDFRGRRLERFEYVPKLSVSHDSSAGSQERVLLKPGFHVKVSVKDGAEVEPDADVVRIEIRAPESCKVKSVKKEAVVVSLGGKKDRRIDIPAVGFSILVREGEKLESAAPIAVRRFTAPSAGTVTIKESKDGTQVIEVLAKAEENLSAVFEKGKLVESPAVVGSEPRVQVGSSVTIKDVIGIMPSFTPKIANLTGRIEFLDVALQKEGNEQIVVQPQGSSASIGVMLTWRGSEHVLGPEQKLLVEPGQSVKIGDLIAKGGDDPAPLVSPCEGVLEIVRRYRTKDGKEVLVVRVVEKIDRQVLPYLEYSKPSASTGKSKALTKAKKQNIKLLAKTHMVRSDLFDRYEKFRDELHAKIRSLGGRPTEGDGGTEFVFPTVDALRQIFKYEVGQIMHGEYLAHGGPDKHHAVCEAGDLVFKVFSDVRTSKEGATEKSGMNKDITEGLPRVEALLEKRGAPYVAPPPLLEGQSAEKCHCIFDGGRYCRGCGRDFGVGAGANQCPDCGEIAEDSPKHVYCGTCGNPIETRRHPEPSGGQSIEHAWSFAEEVLQIYAEQGIDVSIKHLEVIVSRMVGRAKVLANGDREFMDGTIVNRKRALRAKPGIVLWIKPFGITKTAKYSESFISAASFQETTWALTEAAFKGKKDRLQGLKEAVVIGHLIPAGTGMKMYREGIEPDSIPEDAGGADGASAESLPSPEAAVPAS